MSRPANISAAEALERLKAGNHTYLNAKTCPGDVSPAKRADTCEHGQHPYAVIIGCSDSRAVPEDIFSAGIGELFVIRVAGNVIDSVELGSVEYAAEHLGCRLVVVLGHDNCGAVGAAMGGDDAEGFIKTITDEIKRAIGTEPDYEKACRLNVRQSVEIIQQRAALADDVQVVGALYHIHDGWVEFDI